MKINVLKNYFLILKGKKKPRFQIAKKKNLLTKKIKQAYKILESCKLCERKCKVNRTKGQEGYCQLQDKMQISSWFDHWGEERFLVPSFTIFFWSCTFRCVYCQNWQISQRYEIPKQVSEQDLAKIINGHSHCRNINFVGGEPTPQLPFILKTLSYVKSNIPVVWNSNFYMSQITMGLLKNIVDVYLSDFKYGNDKCAKRLSDVNNYMAIVKRNHLLAASDSEMIIRHLVLPNHVECCSKVILKWIAKNLGKRVIVNIMDQYRPDFLVLRQPEKYKEINKPLEKKEFQKVMDYVKKLDLNFIS